MLLSWSVKDAPAHEAKYKARLSARLDLSLGVAATLACFRARSSGCRAMLL